MNIKEKYTSDDLFKDYGKLTFGEVLRGFRLSEDMSQNDFAKRLGISAANVCDLEKGRKIPSLTRTIKIARKLKISDRLLVQLVLQDMLRREKISLKISVAA